MSGSEYAPPSGSAFPPVLDACCGGRHFWFDKKDGRALFVDKRRETIVWGGKQRPGRYRRSAFQREAGRWSYSVFSFAISQQLRHRRRHRISFRRLPVTPSDGRWYLRASVRLWQDWHSLPYSGVGRVIRKLQRGFTVPRARDPPRWLNVDQILLLS